MLFSQKTHKTH